MASEANRGAAQFFARRPPQLCHVWPQPVGTSAALSRNLAAHPHHTRTCGRSKSRPRFQVRRRRRVRRLSIILFHLASYRLRWYRVPELQYARERRSNAAGAGPATPLEYASKPRAIMPWRARSQSTGSRRAAAQPRAQTTSRIASARFVLARPFVVALMVSRDCRSSLALGSCTTSRICSRDSPECGRLSSESQTRRSAAASRLQNRCSGDAVSQGAPGHELRQIRPCLRNSDRSRGGNNPVPPIASPLGGWISRGPRAVGKRTRNRFIMRGVQRILRK